MGAGQPPSTPPTSILLTGAYNSGKKRMVAAFANKTVAEVLIDDTDNWSAQLKATKGSVTLVGMPEQYGRFPSFRETNKAVADANAYILVVKPTENERGLKNYYQPIKEYSKGGPIMILVSHITDTPVSYTNDITKFAKSINAKIDTINPTKLSDATSADAKKMESIIENLVNSVHPSSTPAPVTATPTPTGDEPTKVAPTKAAPTKVAPSKASNPVVRFFSSIFTKNSVVAAA